MTWSGTTDRGCRHSNRSGMVGRAVAVSVRRHLVVIFLGCRLIFADSGTAQSFDHLFRSRGVYCDLAKLATAVGTIKSLDVDSIGRLLVLDSVARKLWLIDSRCDSSVALDPSKCHPGLFWDPQFAVFMSGGSVAAITAPLGNTIFLFDSRGRCTGEVEYDRRVTLRVCSFRRAWDGALAVAYTWGTDRWGLAIVSRGCSGSGACIEARIEGTLPHYPVYLSHAEHAVQVAVDERSGILAMCFDGMPELHLYDSHLHLLHSFPARPRVYHEMKRDLRYPDESARSRAAMEMVSNATHIDKLFVLDGGLFMVQYVDRRVKGAQLVLVDKHGRAIGEAGILTPERVFGVSGNFVYTLHQPRALDRTGNLPNPQILSYRLVVRSGKQ